MSALLSPPRDSAIALDVVSDDGDVVRAKIAGRITHRFHATFDEPLAAALGFDAYSRQVLLDLSDVSAIDTSGINWLLTAHQRMEYIGGKLVLHSLAPVVRNVIRVLNLQAVLVIADNEFSAEQLLAGGNQ